jgi:hypothetical protein
MVPGVEKARNRMLGLSNLRRVREACAMLSDNSEDVHRDGQRFLGTDTFASMSEKSWKGLD